jgi:transcriptional regulator of acetoin/glycerol metabolism
VLEGYAWPGNVRELRTDHGAFVSLPSDRGRAKSARRICRSASTGSGSVRPAAREGLTARGARAAAHLDVLTATKWHQGEGGRG